MHIFVLLIDQGIISEKIEIVFTTKTKRKNHWPHQNSAQALERKLPSVLVFPTLQNTSHMAEKHNAKCHSQIIIKACFFVFLLAATEGNTNLA